MTRYYKQFFPFFVLLSSCTTVLVQTTGPDGLTEDPTERTTGALVEDKAIETKIGVNVRAQEPELKKSNIDVTSHNGFVLITGQVQSEQLKNRVTEIAREASLKIKTIQNELEVAGKTSLIARGNDAWIATKVRTLMFADKTVPSDQIRVVTENGAVFLMGLVHREEGNLAGNLARNVAGVPKVVEVFEYLD